MEFHETKVQGVFGLVSINFRSKTSNIRIPKFVSKMTNKLKKKCVYQTETPVELSLVKTRKFVRFFKIWLSFLSKMQIFFYLNLKFVIKYPKPPLELSFIGIRQFIKFFTNSGDSDTKFRTFQFLPQFYDQPPLRQL